MILKIIVYIYKIDMYDFSMTGAVGRGYRYYQGTPIFTFGQGKIIK